MRVRIAACVAAWLMSTQAFAIVGGQPSRDPDGLRQHTVRIESSRGELCTGVVLGPELVLTAAHCVIAPARYHVYVLDRSFRSRSFAVSAIETHNDFVPGTTPRSQPGVDLAVLKLAQPLPSYMQPLAPSSSSVPPPGDVVKLAGFGLASETNRRSARTLRETELRSVGIMRVANRVLVAIDDGAINGEKGSGACRGDSGGPLVSGQDGTYALVGIVSWSSGPLSTSAEGYCGGLTAVTPISDHTQWITSRSGNLLAGARSQPEARYSSSGPDWVSR